jgi:DNA (cytosine-5)-methyltransferase 1
MNHTDKLKKKMKILVGFAGIGGESELWDDSENQIIHVEIDPKIAQVIKDRKPNRTVIVGDAVEYLLKHYQDFDIIWLSPPCQANSRMIRSGKNRTPRLPDLLLYELKIFLDFNFNGKYVIENVIPYYPPPIPPTAKIGRHLFWSNFEIDENFEIKQPKGFINKTTVAGSEELKQWLGINYEGNIYYNGNHNPGQVLANCVHPKLGLHVFKCYKSTNNKTS